MDTQITRKTSPIVTPKSNLLANQARKEILLNGETVVVCPKCNTKPEISMSSNGERVTVSCKCGYICDVEIMF